ncbi:MAG: DUF3175 domain-containing protein [Nitrospira sp.]|nr:DUF3175 domain-containing protein [Nitrospira sp.]
MAPKAKPSPKAHPKTARTWSADVMKRSNALDLEEGVFTKKSAKLVAESLKRSAMQSRRRKGTPFQSAMSMLNFHINRAGKSLSPPQKSRLEQAKDELRRLFGRTSMKNGKPSGKRASDNGGRRRTN